MHKLLNCVKEKAMAFWTKEEYAEVKKVVNEHGEEDENRITYSDSGGVYDTGIDNIGELFKRLQKGYGRCVSKMYVDRGEKSQHVGWVFESKQQYEDTGEHGIPAKYYIREVWVTVYTAPPTVQTTYHYADLGKIGRSE